MARPDSQRLRKGVPVLLAAVWVAAAAVSVEPASARESQRAFLTLRVNQVQKGEVLAVLDGGDVRIDKAALERAGLDLSLLAPESETSESGMVSMRSLAPRVEFRVDLRELTLDLTTDPEVAGRTVVDMQAGRPRPTFDESTPSAFLNYSVAGAFDNSDETTAFTEAGARLFGSLLTSTFTVTADGEVARGLSSLSRDSRESLRRWTLGDVIDVTDSLGGSVLLGGFSVSREFGIDPYLVRHPTTGFSGALRTPSTVEVWVDNQLVYQQDLPPGLFEIENLQVPSTRATARLVVRDAFGREQEYSQPFDFSGDVLAPGLSDYSFSVGWLRRDLVGGDVRYGEPAAIGRYRRGLTARVTAGSRLEVSDDLVSAGATLDARLPGGSLSLLVGASSNQGESDLAAAASYQYVRERFSFGVGLRSFGRDYANLSRIDVTDSLRLDGTASGRYFFGSGLVLGARYSRQEFSERDRFENLEVSGAYTFGGSMRFDVALGQVRFEGQAPAWRGSVGLAASLGRRAYGRIGTDYDGQDWQLNGQLTRSVPAGPGFGYSLFASDGGGSQRGQGRFDYRSRVGRYELSQRYANGEPQTGFRLSGGLVAIGGVVRATREVQEGFALVRVPGFEGVRVYADNQPMGRTDRQGRLLVPRLLPYYANRIRIADDDLPFNAQVETIEQQVATPYRAGAVVSFPVHALNAVRGRLRLLGADGEVDPSGAIFKLVAGDLRFESPVGRTGRFYFEDVPPGRYRGTVEKMSAVCALTVDVPSSTEPILDLGVLSCRFADIYLSGVETPRQPVAPAAVATRPAAPERGALSRPTIRPVVSPSSWPSAVIAVPSALLRLGPGRRFHAAGGAVEGERYVIARTNVDRSWLGVVAGRDRRVVWVARDVVEVVGSLERLPSTAAVGTATIKPINPHLRVRALPDRAADTVYRLEGGTSHPVLETSPDGGWLRVDIPGLHGAGWVAAGYTEFQPNGVS